MKNKVRIALIDSGIIDNSYINIDKGVCIRYDVGRECIKYESNYSDENGHGTFCTQVITSYCKEIQFIIIKILDKELVGYSRALVEALNYILPSSIDIVNLSLSVFEYTNANEIKELCWLLWKKGVIINVSVANNKTTSFPASLKSTIGVRGALNIPSNKIWYNQSKEIQCIASMMPVLVCAPETRMAFFGGNSKATAVVTGLLAMIIYEKQINGYEALMYLNQKSCWCEKDIQKEFNTDTIDRADLGLREFACQVCDILKLDKSYSERILIGPISPPYINIDQTEFTDLIAQLSLRYDRELEKGKIEITNFISLASLYNIFLENKYE